MTVRVYIDLRCLQDHRYARRGIGRHCAAVIRGCRTHCSDNTDIIGLCDPSMPTPAADDAALVDRCEPIRSPYHDNTPTILLQPSPMTHRQDVLAAYLGLRRIQTAAILYDFIPVDDQRDRYLPDPLTRRNYIADLAWCKLYDHYCAISDYTAGRACDILGVPRSRVHTTGAAVRDSFSMFNADSSRPTEPACAFEPRRYIVVVGGHDERKNAETVIDAHATVLNTTTHTSGLVVVGNYEDDYRDALIGRYVDAGGSGDRIRFVRGISDLQLAWLYHDALVSVCPSRIEGFSLPVMEAVECGCPVLAADSDAQAELVTDPDALFAPYDTQRLCAMLVGLHDNPAHRDVLYERQKHLCGAFTESAVAERVWTPLLGACRSNVCHRTRTTCPDKPRIAYVTIYPPHDDALAEHSAGVVQALRKHARVDVFAENDQARMDNADTIQPASPLPYVTDTYDHVVSVVSNSAACWPVAQLHSRYGSTLTVHSPHLAMMYNHARGTEELARMASAQLGRRVSVKQCLQWLVQPQLMPVTFAETLAEAARPLIVHTHSMYRALADAYEPVLLPVCVPVVLAESDLTPDARLAARRRMNIDTDKTAVVSFGDVSRHHAAVDCLWTLESLLGWDIDAELHFAGSPGNLDTMLWETADRLRLRDRVRVHAITRRQDYYDMLAAADAALVVRLYGMDQLPAQALHCLGVGLPVVVNQDECFRTDADDPPHLLRIPHRISPLLAGERITDALCDNLHEQRFDEPRREYINKHSYDHYARNLVEALQLNSHDCHA